ncbi:MAG: PQQ-dependent sugar dehydrogenase [Pseudomonadota bacterium]
MRELLRCAAVLLAPLGSALAQQPEVVLEPYVDGLALPIGIASANDGTHRLFIVEQNGTIRIVAPDGSLQENPWLDLSTFTGSGLTAASGERGLLGLAFHPEFVENGRFFVNYTTLGPSFHTVIARYVVDPGDPSRADPDSEVRLLEIPQPFSNHNGGEVSFGPDGFLHVGVGDGGSAGDPREAGQDTGTLLGKVLRIDVDSAGGSTSACGDAVSYGIPADNPWPNEAGTCAEIWALGARNPYRFSFDRRTGDLWIGDVGQNRVEEINRLDAGQAGANLGWDCREGSTAYGLPSDPGDPSAACATVDGAQLIDPVIEYDHDLPGAPCYSVTGGFVFRGPVPLLDGTYIAGEFCTGDLLVATGRGNDWSFEFQPGAGDFSLGGFGEDERGQLYVVDRGGVLLRVTSPQHVFFGGFEN